MNKYDVIIVGGGASGVTCAINLKKKDPSLKVLLLEQNDKVLKKVLKTGNGKCNLSNKNIDGSHYHNYDAFKDYFNKFDAGKYFLDLGLITKSDNQGRIYPYSEASSSVVNLLLYELEKEKIEVKCNYIVEKVERNDNYIINGEYSSKVLVIATGSNAQAKTNGYELAKSLNHKITKLVPVLTPIKVKEDIKSLAGLKVKCNLKVNSFNRCGELLFKDDAISGILVLEASRYTKASDVISLDLVPDYSLSELKEYLIDDKEIKLNGLVPKMLVKKINGDIGKLKDFRLTVDSLYGFSYSQITRGGVTVDELKETFESKINSNLYLIGEVVDVDGDCGGYNLNFAWLSGYFAAENIIKSI